MKQYRIDVNIKIAFVKRIINTTWSNDIPERKPAFSFPELDTPFTSFGEDTVVTAVEKNASDANYKPLKENLEKLQKMRLLSGKQLNIIELPMPDPVYFSERRSGRLSRINS